MLNAKEKRGLGVVSLKAHDLALLGKWSWRFKIEGGMKSCDLCDTWPRRKVGVRNSVRIKIKHVGNDYPT